MEVSLRNVVRRGLDHALSCEDEALSTIFNDRLAIMVVFDGCSKGEKSSFASGLLGKIFRKILIQDKFYYEEAVDEVSLENICRYTIRRAFLELKHIVHYLELVPKEVLATIVLAVVDLEKGEAHAIMIGDGSIYVDGHIESINCPGNQPQYLAYFLHYEEFKEVWHLSVAFSKSYKFEKTVAVMSDGIDSFFNRDAHRYVNEEERAMIIDTLLKSDRYLKSKIGLAKLCNILQTENKFEPVDDLAISRLTLISPVANDSIQQTGTED